MTLEFGPPQDLYQACIRIPDRSHPEYEIKGGPYEHCTHLKEFLEDMAAIGCDSKLYLENRMCPLETEDLRLLYNLNSFKRNLDSPTTADWSSLEG